LTVDRRPTRLRATSSEAQVVGSAAGPGQQTVDVGSAVAKTDQRESLRWWRRSAPTSAVAASAATGGRWNRPYGVRTRRAPPSDCEARRGATRGDQPDMTRASRGRRNAEGRLQKGAAVWLPAVRPMGVRSLRAAPLCCSRLQPNRKAEARRSALPLPSATTARGSRTLRQHRHRRGALGRSHCEISKWVRSNWKH
jgi:hypothetical protein